MKVSVIVPVWNPGRYIDPCIRSLLEQSLPADEYEAIFVDDGSTDDIPARLDALAAEHPNFTVIHQENSGWPGRPRNVGLDAARAEYVFFLDQDDWLGTEALERMYEMASRNHSDVLVAKMAGHGRRVPRALFARNIDHATLDDTPLIDGLTPHKLFRRAFLEGHGIRFPEGKRRLEDHPFVLRSYFLGESISVLADYVCYYHTRRADLGNAGLRRIDPAGYYGNLREVLSLVEAFTEPGPRRDGILSRFARSELLERLRGRQFLSQPEDYRHDLFDQIRGVILDHVPESVDRRLAPVYRVQAALVRQGRRDFVEALAMRDAAIVARATAARRPSLQGRVLHLELRGRLTYSGKPLARSSSRWDGPALARGDGEWLLALPPSIAEAVPLQTRRVPDRPTGTALVLVRRRADSAEFVTRPDVEVELDGAPSGPVRLSYRLRIDLDPASLMIGHPLPPGIWALYARFEQHGYAAETALGVRLVVGDDGSVHWVRPRGLAGLIRRLCDRLPPSVRPMARAACRGARAISRLFRFSPQPNDGAHADGA